MSNDNRIGETCSGRSILEILWEQLDSMYAALLDAREHPSENHHDIRLSGVCRGFAYCIATIQAPYEPDVKAVLREMKERARGDK